MRLKSHILRAAAGILAAVALMAASGTTAVAGESYSDGKNYWDGKNPAQRYGSNQPCNVNARQIATRPIVEYGSGRTVATLQMFYSNSCQTNWIRVTGNPYGGETVKYLSSSLGGWNSETDTGTGSSFSMMVYAPGTTRINGYVSLSTPVVGDWRDFRAKVDFAF